MADTSNHVSVADVLENTTLDPDAANDTLTEWASKTKRIEGSNVRDEALDSFALGPMRSTYIAKANGGIVETKSDGDPVDQTLLYYSGWLGNGEKKAPIQPASGSIDWKQVNLAKAGLTSSGGFATALRGSTPAIISFPLYAMNAFRGDAFNEYNRWVIYCSCEAMVQRPRVNSPQIELALGYSFTGSSAMGDWTIIPETRRGLGIGKTGPDLAGGGAESVPTSLSYTVVNKFAPSLSASDGGPTGVAGTENFATVYVSLFGRYVDGRDWHTWKDRFWWAAMNVNMFAVNYRR